MGEGLEGKGGCCGQVGLLFRLSARREEIMSNELIFSFPWHTKILNPNPKAEHYLSVLVRHLPLNNANIHTLVT